LRLESLRDGRSGYSPRPVEPQKCETRVLPADEAGIAEAARLIRDGLPVAVPTETVYGLAADATNETAVRRIYDAKGRPSFNPLIVHVPRLEQAERIGQFGDAAREAARRWWPGPLTIVIPLRPDCGLAASVTAGLPTVALRCPAHLAMRRLLDTSRRPLAAPSANASGGISATTADHVMKTLGGRIPLILDGGATETGLESTIVGFSGESARLLRPGPVPFEEILALAALGESPSGAIEAPGQLRSHYAPAKPLRLHAHQAEPDEWLIGFGAMDCDDNLSSAADLEEAAARLFGALHRAEGEDRPRIAVAAVPERGIGIAINDRLRRAAATKKEG
jgi:L-threonylcarbamoyladenylate synthase